jgi:hypothetical protein
VTRIRIASGKVRRPASCSLTVSPETLAAAGYPDLQAAHNAAVCVRLWAAERHHQADEAAETPKEGR